MHSTLSPLADALVQGWQEYQEQLGVIVRDLTPEQLSARAAPQLRTVGETAAHLVAGRAFWFAEVLHEGDEEAAAIAHWDEAGQPTRRAGELAHALDLTSALMQRALGRWTPEELTEPIILPWIGPKYPITRAWVVWHVLEHDLHHGGELTHALGTLGLDVKLPPPPADD